MKPQYANTFGIRKVSDKEGEILEVTLDIAYKYMETAVTVTAKGGGAGKLYDHKDQHKKTFRFSPA